MADTTVSSAVNVEQWADKEFREYVRGHEFKQLMGKKKNKPINVKWELTKEAGDKITFSLVGRLTGAGVTGDNTLAGNEEALGNYGHKVEVDQIRNGVVVGQFEKIKTKIDLLEAGRDMLRQWNMEQLRDLFIARLFSPVTDGATTYSAATEAQKDAWVAANNPTTANQRILFGAAKSNQSGDHSADLGNIDATNDDLHQDIIRIIKRMAQSADPRIRPAILPKAGNATKEGFYMLAGSYPFRDLQANMDTIFQNADVRGERNQIFASDTIRVGNVIVIEVPEMDETPANGGTWLENVGDSSTVDVEPVFLLGAQALGLAWAQTMQIKTDSWDYQNRRGVACCEIRGCEKLTFNSSRQHGLATAYVSAQGD